jgi:methionyl-tRNA synthetase
MNLARLGNKYLADNEPWKSIKTDPEAAAKVIATSLQIAAHLSQVLAPFLPFTAQKLADMLKLDTTYVWGEVPAVLLPAGHVIGEGELLFTRFEDADVDNEVEKLKAKAKANANAVTALPPVKPTVSFEQFQAMDIRIGTIIEAQRVPKTAKLLQLKIDIGTEVRTVVSGIAESYSPENIIGQQVSLLCNLAPRNIKGIESQGMVLMAEDADGKLAFVAPDRAVRPGSGVA